MNPMKRVIYTLLLFVLTQGILQAQELNARVTVNAQKISGSRQLFESLEEELNSFVNDRRWSDLQFQEQERISCTFTLVVNEATSPNSFKGELMVQAQRPVFNATYQTPLLNYRDAQFAFEYTDYQPLQFNISNLTDNLTAIIAYYIYMILGLDFDSMSPLGGTPFYRQMMTIATSAQSMGWSGWEYSSTGRTRYSVADIFSSGTYDAYREMWYQYHRKGLDEMSENIEKSRENVLTSLSVISALHNQRPNSPLLTLFGEAKLSELINVLSEATATQKRESHATLSRIYPVRQSEIDQLKQ